MTRGPAAGLAASIAVALIACAPDAATVHFRVRGAPPDEPFLGADAIVAVLEQDGRPLPPTERRFSAEATELALDALPFGERLALRVETRGRLPGGAEFVIARGRSFPFDLPSADRAPGGGAADVLLGTLGRYVAPLGASPLDAPAALVVPSARGATIATATSLYRYRAHDPSTGGALLERALALPPELHDARWAPMPDGALLAGGAATPALTLFASDGGELLGEIALPAAAVAIAPSTRGAIAVLATGEILFVEHYPEAGLRTSPLSPAIDPALSAASLLVVPVRVDDRDEERIVLVTEGEIVRVDPGGGEPIERAPLGGARSGRAIAIASTNEIAIAGGRDAAGTASDALEVWAVMPLTPITPSPPPLFSARSGASAIAAGPRLLLIAGGLGALGEPMAGTELVDLSVLPGDVTATGSLPTAAASARGCALRDRSVLVAFDREIAVYFPPRGGG